MAREKSVPRTGETQEELPDAWERFERAVDVALKTPPMHKESPKKPAKRVAKTKAKKA